MFEKLIEKINGTTYSYIYDNANQRLTAPNQSYTYDSTTKRLSSITSNGITQYFRYDNLVNPMFIDSSGFCIKEFGDLLRIFCHGFEMSDFLLINLKKKNTNYEELNNLTRRIVAFSLKNNIGVSFNSYDYYEKIITENEMENFFFISSSFLFKNCDLLYNSILDSNLVNKKKIFLKKFKFLRKLIGILLKNKIQQVEIYVSGSPVDKSSEFKEIKTQKKELLEVLFNEVCRFYSNNNYGFPSLKIITY